MEEDCANCTAFAIRVAELENQLSNVQTRLHMAEAKLAVFEWTEKQSKTTTTDTQHPTGDSSDNNDDIQIIMDIMEVIDENSPAHINFDNPLFSSKTAVPGRPDPSIKHHPPSRWYLWFCSPEATNPQLHPPPESPPNCPVPNDFPQPSILLGEAWADRELSRINKANKNNAPAPTPAPVDKTLVPCGPWSALRITTALQAHNLRHLAVSDGDTNATRFYKQVHANLVKSTYHRSEGEAYLATTYSIDVKHFQHDMFSNGLGELTALGALHYSIPP
ncbi:hypothetical protein C8Q80DRAFT_1265685 [Daedaleopsis nitida]|nr:hypothetical protein C8Q80DRAFT_1265685 [Daedaleopsis nitida]